NQTKISWWPQRDSNPRLGLERPMGSDFINFPNRCPGPVPLRGLFRGRTLRKRSRTINQSRNERAPDFQVRSCLTASGSMRTPRFLLIVRAGRLARIGGGRHLLRLSHNPATETLYADITQRPTT